MKVKKELYFTILNLLREGKKPAEISNSLNLKKQNLQYYLTKLKQEGLIKKRGYGTWEVQKKTSNTLVQKSRKIRGHAFIWKIQLNKEIDWIDKLEKSKLDYKLVRGIIPRVFINRKKVWLGKKTITIYEPESFYGNNAISSRKYAVISLIEALQALEKKLVVSLHPYIFTPTREHYAMIKNDLAKQLNRNNEKMTIKDNGKEWLWVDMSDGVGELETGNDNALVNNIGVQRWWNDMKKTKFEWTPKVIAENFGKTSELLNQVTERLIKVEEENLMLKNQLKLNNPVTDNAPGRSYIG